jgi:triosephosphate isomerase
MRQKVLVGNWKMYKNVKEAEAFAEEFKVLFTNSEHEVGFCCPFIQLVELRKAFEGTPVKVGAQNMHYEEEGAYTGEISPNMLTEIGVDYCIIGHSERRQYFGETDETVNLKLKASYKHGITPILCVGENLEQRDGDKAQDVVKSQIKNDLEGLISSDVAQMILAYEPIWAIGTGRTASPEQAEEMCAFIRETIKDLYDSTVSERVRIQYGGSVKPANAKELMTQTNIDGALVGGASLKAEDFIKIVEY